jgi:DNA repair protein RadC
MLIRHAAAAVLFCHNHPSGDPTPSRQDLDLTTRLKNVGELCGIRVIDHVIVAADGFVSLAERGYL